MRCPNATEEEQLEALLVETERRITPLFGEPQLTGSDLVMLAASNSRAAELGGHTAL